MGCRGERRRDGAIRARRSLRVLAWAGAAFVLAQLVGGLLLDYRWPDVRFPLMGRVFVNLKTFERPPEIVFMGSSRFAGLIRPCVMDPTLRQYTRNAPRTFNAAVPGGDALVAERMLDRMLREGHRPALLVLEISPEQLNRQPFFLQMQVIRQMTWTDLPSYFPDVFLYTSKVRLLFSRLFPLYVHRYQLRKETLGIIAAGCTTTRSESAAVEADLDDAQRPNLFDLPPIVPRPPEPPSGPHEITTFTLETVSHWLRNYQLSPVAMEALERLLNRCNVERIDVLLVGVPAMKGNCVYLPVIDATYREYIHALMKKYGCHFVDLRDSVPDYCFNDAVHTDDVGGEYFSRVITRDVLIPLWRELHP